MVPKSPCVWLHGMLPGESWAWSKSGIRSWQSRLTQKYSHISWKDEQILSSAGFFCPNLCLGWGSLCCLIPGYNDYLSGWWGRYVTESTFELNLSKTLRIKTQTCSLAFPAPGRERERWTRCFLWSFITRRCHSAGKYIQGDDGTQLGAVIGSAYCISW